MFHVLFYTFQCFPLTFSIFLFFLFQFQFLLSWIPVLLSAFCFLTVLFVDSA